MSKSEVSDVLNGGRSSQLTPFPRIGTERIFRLDTDCTWSHPSGSDVSTLDPVSRPQTFLRVSERDDWTVDVRTTTVYPVWRTGLPFL